MTKKQQIRDLYDRHGYVYDRMACEVYGDESGCWKKIQVVSDYKRFLANRRFFENKKIIGKEKGHRAYYVKVDENGKEVLYKTCKEFWQSI